MIMEVHLTKHNHTTENELVIKATESNNSHSRALHVDVFMTFQCILLLYFYKNNLIPGSFTVFYL